MSGDLAWLEGHSRLVTAKQDSADGMWALMETLFPIYRSLCGPGFKASLDAISGVVPLTTTEIPSGRNVHGWTVPKEFSVKEAWVEAPGGARIMDFDRDSYGLWLYSQPFSGTVTRDELLTHVGVNDAVPEALPLRHTYYQENWGVTLPKATAEQLPDGDYKVHIDTKLEPGCLRIGEAYLPGESEDEVLICSYLCHPKGANDNLSGVVVATELFRLLSELPSRRYSYRLALWPETIGAISYIATYPERLRKMAAGFSISICGDASPVGYEQTIHGDQAIDRAMTHALELCSFESEVRAFSQMSGSDIQHFNAVGVRAPFGTITRSGPGYDNQNTGVYPPGYSRYHSSADDLSFVKPENLLETLQAAFLGLQTLERTARYKGTFTVSPFLTKYGIYPHHHGVGSGGMGNVVADAYYQLMPFVDGDTDLLQIAERARMPIFAFDEAVEAFSRVGLIEKVG